MIFDYLTIINKILDNIFGTERSYPYLCFVNQLLNHLKYTFMYWTTGSGSIELNITKKDAELCSHPGPCDNDVLQLSDKPAIKKQLVKIPAELLANELKEYGAWNENELQDHSQNLQRILWIAAGDISEGRD